MTPIATAEQQQGQAENRGKPEQLVMPPAPELPAQDQSVASADFETIAIPAFLASDRVEVSYPLGRFGKKLGFSPSIERDGETIASFGHYKIKTLDQPERREHAYLGDKLEDAMLLSDILLAADIPHSVSMIYTGFDLLTRNHPSRFRVGPPKSEEQRSVTPELWQNLRESAKRSLVDVILYDKEGVKTGAGSGVIVKHRDNIYSVLTNTHVARNGHSYQLTTHDGEEYRARFIARSQRDEDIRYPVDLSLLEFEAPEGTLTPATLSDERLSDGELLLVAGRPKTANGYFDFFAKHLPEDHNCFRRSVRSIYGNASKTFLSVEGFNPDLAKMSGGGLFDLKGELKGIIAHQVHDDKRVCAVSPFSINSFLEKYAK